MENTWDFGLSPISIEIDSTGSAVGALDVLDVGNVNVLPFKVFGLGGVMLVEFLDKFIKWRKSFRVLSRFYDLGKAWGKVENKSSEKR